MNLNDMRICFEHVVRKYDGVPEFQEQIDEMKSNIEELKSFSEEKLKHELSPKREKFLKEGLKKLGINFSEIK